MEKDTERKKLPEWLPAAGMSLFLLGFVWTVLGNYFETNDDRFIAEILSGAIGGQPEAHVVYVNYLLSWPISVLYRLNVRIPWYGLLLLLFQIFTYTALFQSAYSRGKSVVEKAVIAGFMGSCVLLNLYITVAVQYTSTAAIMAVTGYMCLLLDQKQRRRWLLFCFFEGMAFLLRDQAMLMIQPVGLLVCSSEFWGESEKGKKEWAEKTGCMVLIIAVIVLTGSAGTLAGYHGEGWANFKRFNQARTEMFDYYGSSEYEEVKDILDKYGVSCMEYEAFRRNMSLRLHISTECVEELVDYEKRVYTEKPSAFGVMRKILGMRNDEDYLKVGWVNCIAGGAALLWLFLRKRISALVTMMGLAAGSLFVEGYLVYRERLPHRVMLPLFCCEIFFVIAILLRDYTNGKRSMRHRVFICLAAALFVFAFAFSGRQQYYSVKEDLEWQKDSTEELVAVQEYCRAHPEKRYILDIRSFYNCRGRVLETRLAGPQNSIYSGGWIFNSPVMNDFLHDYLDGEEENICLIAYDNELGEENYIVAFLAEALGKKSVIMDKFEVSNGAVYLVWGFMDD